MGARLMAHSTVVAAGRPLAGSSASPRGQGQQPLFSLVLSVWLGRSELAHRTPCPTGGPQQRHSRELSPC